MRPSAQKKLNEDLSDRFTAIVGPEHAFTQAADLAPFLQEPRDLYRGQAAMVLRPADTEQVSAILKLAGESGTAIVPSGGGTGLVGGQIPDASGQSVILSLARLNRIRNVDSVGNTLTAEAGVILADLQRAAEEADRLFPLSLGAEGSCQIGGNLSTNAGGTAVLAYGTTRQLCLGLEVVLPTGEIWNGLRRLKKDNTGYDLRDLFIGAEGTLGVITAAVLTLFPKPAGRQVAFAGVTSPQAAVDLFDLARSMAGPSLTAFELMPRIGIEFTLAHIERTRDPVPSVHPWYCLVEISAHRSQDEAHALMETILETAMEKELLENAVFAASESQRQDFWRLREEMSWAQKPEGGSIKHDISVPVHAIPEFMEKADRAVLKAVSGARIVAFGHIGDGNIHYNISQPIGADSAEFLARWEEITGIVHAIVKDFEGSISAEHGIGQMKREELSRSKAGIEMKMMRQIKAAFDPAGIMNPGKVL